MGRPLRRILVIVLAACGAAVGIAVIGLVIVLTTSFGARQALRLAAQRIPGELSVGEVDGSLYSGLELGDVRYRSETVDARFESLSLEPSLSDLVESRWVLNRLHAGNGRVEIVEDPSTDAEDEDFALPDLPAGLEIRDFRIEDVRLDGLGAPTRIETLTGSLQDSSVELDQLVVEAAGTTFVASGHSMLSADRAMGTLTGVVRLPSEGADAGAAETIAFDATFIFEERAGDVPWQASIDWSRLEWQRAGAENIVSPSGRLIVRPGADEAFGVSLRASVEGEPLPGPASLTASGAVSADTVNIDRARLELAGGEAVVTGAFRLDTQSGYASIDFRGVDPSQLGAPIEGALRGSLDAAVAAEPTLRIAGTGQVAGELDGRPIDGRVVASYADEALSIERGEVTLDEGRVVVDGRISPETADLRFSARVPRIGHWYPPVAGSLTAEGSIAGDTDNPRVDIDLESEDLVWEAAPAPPIEHVALRIDGTRASHLLRLDAESAVGSAVLEVEQRYADGEVDGRLVESVLEPQNAGVWRLAEAARYSASADQIELETACFAGPDDARLCAAVDREALTLDARAVPSGLVEPWLPQGFEVAGTTDLEAEVALAGPLEGSLTVRHRMLRIGVESEVAAANFESGVEAAPEEVVPLLDLADVTLRASLDPDALEIELTGGRASDASGSSQPEPDRLAEPPEQSEQSAEPPEQSEQSAELPEQSPEPSEQPTDAGPAAPSLVAPSALSGRLTVSPPAADGRLDGFVTAELTELGLIGTLVDGVDDLTGVVDARLAFSGTPGSPSIGGRVSAANLAAELPPLGIDITDGRFSADLTDLQAVPFDAALCSQGCARITGRLRLPREGDFRLTANVEGEEVLLVDLPELRAVATPRFEVSATPELATIVGMIAIPEGTIEVEDVPRSAVRPAAGTVVHGRETPEDEEDALPVPLTIALQASLGDVRFEGLGLEAQLDGMLDIERTIDGDWIVQGTTTIEEGTFTAYGQTLEIEQGLLVFTGPPGNPTLDIRATRVVDDAEVGLLITGTAQDPRSEVFSEAGLPESEAFAQLLTGRSIGELGESDPEALERAAIGLGLRRALPTLDRIGAALGLDELGVQSTGETAGAVVAGRRIGDDVYLRYRYGLFDDFSGLELIYRITERFRLRTETGTAQSIDLIYEMEPGDPDTLEEDIEEIDVAIQEQGESATDLLGPDVDAE